MFYIDTQEGWLVRRVPQAASLFKYVKKVILNSLYIYKYKIVFWNYKYVKKKKNSRTQIFRNNILFVFNN